MKYKCSIVFLLLISIVSFAQSENCDSLHWRGHTIIIKTSSFFERTISQEYSDGHGSWSKQFILKPYKDDKDKVPVLIICSGRVSLPDGLVDLTNKECVDDMHARTGDKFYYLRYDSKHDISFYSEYYYPEEYDTINKVINSITWIDL